MYNLESETLTLQGKTEKIKSYEVWFQVPMKGLFSDRKLALQACKEMDLDPQLCIVSLPVAVSETLYEIMVK